MALFFQRDAKMRAYPLTSAGTFPGGSKIFEIPLLEGFSFSQSTNSSEITLSEMESTDGFSRRGRKIFNDSLAPVEWSFSTYLRPFIGLNTGDNVWGDANSHLVDQCLWNAMMSKGQISETSVGEVTAVTVSANGTGYSVGDVLTLTGGTLASGASAAKVQVLTVNSGAVQTVQIVEPGNYTAFTGASATTVSPTGGSGCTITPTLGSSNLDAIIEVGSDTLPLRMGTHTSNRAALQTLALEFQLGSGLTYQLQKAVVNSATVNFDVEGIATVEWSGMAANIATKTGFATNVTDIDASATSATIASTAPIKEGGRAADTENFIRNRLTSMSLKPNSGTASDTAISQTTFDVTLTGGSITYENNISYLTPEELGSVNKPIEHVTGTRSVGGNFTCYLASNAAGNGSKDLFDAMVADAGLGVTTHDFEICFKVGGSSGTPRVEFEMPHVHLEVPGHSIEDVISLESSFSGLQSDLESNYPDDFRIASYGISIA